LLRLDPPLRPADVMPCPLAEDHAYDRLTPRSALEASGGRREKASDLYIIGHPLGQHLCFSMRDTEVLDKGSRHGSPHEYLHYRTPTAKGHSGSPVFDDTDWKVIALHHAGSGAGMMRQLSDPSRRHKANEGVAIKSIRRQVEIDFKNRRRQL